MTDKGVYQILRYVFITLLQIDNDRGVHRILQNVNGRANINIT